MPLTDTPRFSIVIPTHNRPEQLTACLRACARLDYPRDRFEVIVVDDGGEKPLDEVVASFHGTLTLTLLRQENAGPAAARNRGAAEAGGDFLAFTDDDCAPAADWLTALARHCVASPDCGIGGRTVNALPANVYSTASQLVISYLCSFYNPIPHNARFFPSSNLTFPAAPFRAAGGFDVTYPRAAAEDRELCDRWLHLGHRLISASDAVVYHAHALTFRTFLRQHFHYGQGAFCFRQIRAGRRHDRVSVEPLMFYINMLRYPFVSALGAQAPLLMLLLMAAQASNAAGFFWRCARE